MNFSYSEIGEKLSGASGIVELMDDLGHALSGAGATPVHMMGGGNPAHIPEMQAVWRRRLGEIVADPAQCDRMLTNYDPPAGNTRFREAVAGALRREYGWDLGPENVAVTCGGQSAFFYLFNLLAGEPGGGGKLRRVLLPLVPEYIGYADQGLAAGMFTSRRPRIEMLGEHQFKYHVDFDALGLGPVETHGEGGQSSPRRGGQSPFTPKTPQMGTVPDDIAAICVTRPTNPSGNVLSDDEVARLAAIARQRGIPLIIDNAYGEPFPGAVFETIHPMWDTGVILTFSLSKLGLPGVRTGIVVAEAEIVRRIGSMTAIVGLANTNVGQTLVGPLLESGELIRLSREVIRPFYQEKSRHAEAAVRAAFGECFPYAIHRSEGAFFLWLWFPELPISSRELYERLKARGVLIVPGEYFFYGLEDARETGQGKTSEPWPHASQCVRMTFSQSADTIDRGVAIMAEELRRVHGR